MSYFRYFRRSKVQKHNTYIKTIRLVPLTNVVFSIEKAAKEGLGIESLPKSFKCCWIVKVKHWNRVKASEKISNFNQIDTNIRIDSTLLITTNRM